MGKIEYNVVCHRSPAPQKLVLSKVEHFQDGRGYTTAASKVHEKIEISMPLMECQQLMERTAKRVGRLNAEGAFNTLKTLISKPQGGLGQARARKTRDEFIVQTNYGYGQGWEDSTAADTRGEARGYLKDYRSNQPQFTHRLIKRRVKI